MLSLVAAILVLLVGPAVYALVRRRDEMLALLDGLIFVTITGLVLFVILPEAFENGGWPTLLFAAAGLFGPTLLEGSSRRIARRTHLIALVSGLAGLMLHAIMDGSALSFQEATGRQSNGMALPLAVILHRLPVGLTIWWLLRPNFGRGVAVGTLSGITLATVIGYFFGPMLTSGLSGEGMAWFQALVAGTLAHVVFHQPHLHQDACGCRETSRKTNPYEGVGALLGLGLVLLVVAGGTHHPGEEHAASLVGHSTEVFLTLALESAPALLLAYLMAGMLHAFLPYSSILWMGKGSNLSQAFRGMAVGLPFPVCSCGVVPLYQSLIRKGAPPTAAMSFLIATPELGLDAVLLSIPLLGGSMALIRVVGAALVAILAGVIVGRLCARPTLPAQETGSAGPTLTFPQKLGKSLAVGFGEVVDHTAPWIVVGIGVAAMAQPWISSGWLAGIPDYLEVPLFTLIGLPAYVCASGATPLVAVLLAGGVSPGAALAFLLTGPATNVSTFGLLGNLHGRRIAFIFSGTIIMASMGLGFLVNLAFSGAGSGALDPAEVEGTSVFHQVALVLLTAAFLTSLVRRGARRFVAELFFQDQRAIDLHPHYH